MQQSPAARKKCIALLTSLQIEPPDDLLWLAIDSMGGGRSSEICRIEPDELEQEAEELHQEHLDQWGPGGPHRYRVVVDVDGTPTSRRRVSWGIRAVGIKAAAAAARRARGGAEAAAVAATQSQGRLAETVLQQWGGLAGQLHRASERGLDRAAEAMEQQLDRELWWAGEAQAMRDRITELEIEASAGWWDSEVGQQAAMMLIQAGAQLLPELIAAVRAWGGRTGSVPAPLPVPVPADPELVQGAPEAPDDLVDGDVEEEGTP